MTWNFRLVKRTIRRPRRVWYGVHEVFYTDAGRPWTMTQDPVAIDGESVKEVLAYLEMIRKDVKRLPVLDADKTRWAKLPRALTRYHQRSVSLKDYQHELSQLRRMMGRGMRLTVDVDRSRERSRVLPR